LNPDRKSRENFFELAQPKGHESVIRGIKITNFRGIREGELTGFTPLVVLVGPNSSGKSTILDALLLGASPTQIKNSNENPWNIVMKRRVGLQEPHRWMLFRSAGHEARQAQITIRTDTAQSRVATISHHGSNSEAQLVVNISQEASNKIDALPNLGVVVPSRPRHAPPDLEDVPEIRLSEPDTAVSLTDLYTLAAERGLSRQAKSIITELMPDILDIEILSQQNKPVLYLVFKDGAQPLSLAGDGVRLLLETALELAAPVGGTVLLEEPEAHLHPGAIRQSAKAVLAATKRGIQVILTTHSIELIDALLAELSDELLETISFFRLQLHAGVLTSYRLSGMQASFARSQIQDDLR
jgi:predicted ATP-dependent endonuclease of OLD family